MKQTAEEIIKLAEAEFLNIGDEGLFPNHSDKDIWMNGFNAGYATSQHIQGEGNCKCDNEIKTGQTSAMCCNICGLPDDENWKVPSPLPGTTVQGYSEASLSTPQDEGWVWTDALVLEYAVRSHLPNRELTIQEFKQLKQTPTP